MSDDLKLRNATDSVGWLNSEGPLATSPIFSERKMFSPRELDAAVKQSQAPTVKEAFKAGYHCQWIRAEKRYIFDSAMTPGDPDGAFAAWRAALSEPRS